MSLIVTHIVPADESEVDYTDKLRADKEFELGGRAFYGEADGEGQFVLDDDDSVIQPLDDLGENTRIYFEEDASGTAQTLFVGRIAPKSWARDEFIMDRGRSETIRVVDANYDFAGLIVDGWDRPEETPWERVIALRNAYLNGTASTEANPDADEGIWARASTTFGTAYVNSSGTATMPAFTYEGTDPREVLRDCAEWAGYDVFALNVGDRTVDIFFDDATGTAFTSTISISDNPSDTSNGSSTTCYAPIWDLGPAREQDGSEQGSGVLVIGGNESRTYFQLGTSVTDTNDKFEYVEHSDATEQGPLNQFASASAHRRQQAEVRIQCSIKMRSQHVHLIKPGMRVEVKRAYAAAIGTSTYFRAAQVRYSPIVGDDPGWYHVHLWLGYPIKRVRRYPDRKRIPHPPREGTEGTCTRLYFSNASGSITPAIDAAWDNDSSVGGSVKQFKTTADGTIGATGGSNTSQGGDADGRNVLLFKGVYGPISADLAATLAAGGATIRGQACASARFGIGISEASQDMISQIGVRVTQGASATIRGTALALHGLTTSIGAATWPPQATSINRVFPPGPATDTLSAVSGAASGDYLVIEVGMRNYTLVTSGGGVILTSDSDTDLPENETESEAPGYNAWIDICSAGTAGDTTQPIVNPGEESAGTPGCDTYACNDHTHAHGLLSNDELHMHDAATEQYDPTESGLVATNTQAALDELAARVSPEAVVVAHGDMGSTETFDLSDGEVHEGTFSADCTFTFAGATSGIKSRLLLILHQPASGGPYTPTFPSSVVWPDDTEPTWSTAADAVDIIEFISVDGGTTWYGDAGGSGTAASASIWAPLMAQDPSDSKWYVVVDGDGSAVMVET